MKKIIALFFCLCFAIGIPSYCVAQANNFETRLTDVFRFQLKEMLSDANIIDAETERNFEDYSIESICKATDFADNPYTIVECNPTGYMIYHDKSGNFTEWSAVTHSPYYLQTGEFLYAGPNEYYVRNKSNEIKPVFGSSTLSEEGRNALKKTSEAISDCLDSQKNYENLGHLFGREKLANDSMIEIPRRNYTEKQEDLSGWTLISRRNLISNMSDCGYVEVGDGICGYIAAGILLTYKKITGTKNYVDYITHYIYVKKDTYSIKPALPLALYATGQSLGFGNGTVSAEIQLTVEKWLFDRQIYVNHIWASFPKAFNSGIIQNLKNNRPVLWFGSVGDYEYYSTKGLLFHAVTVYGYKGSAVSPRYVAHFGWPNASMVFFTGILGGYYTFSD